MKEKVREASDKKSFRKIIFLFLITITIFSLIFLSASLKRSQDFLSQELQFSLQKIELLENENDYLQKERRTLRDFFNLKTEVEVTAYAPLCSEAITGWDYSGDPRITASGEEVIPWQTAAAGRNIPFGTYVLIEDIGLWRINDRGGLIGPKNIDISVTTSQEARNFGRQRLQAVFLSEEDVKLLEESANIDIDIPLKN